MNPFRQELQNTVASVSFELAIEFGEQVTYTHRGVANVVWALVSQDSSARNRVWANTRSRELPRTFEVPAQTGTTGAFPPTDLPFPGDTFTDENSDLYVVETILPDDVRGVFIFKDCINTKAKTIGTVG
jgi:hypothetical protein